MSTHQNTKINSFGMVAGRSTLFAIKETKMQRITLLTAETKDAAICSPLTISTLFSLVLQKLLISVSV